MTTISVHVNDGGHSNESGIRLSSFPFTNESLGSNNGDLKCRSMDSVVGSLSLLLHFVENCKSSATCIAVIKEGFRSMMDTQD